MPPQLSQTNKAPQAVQRQLGHHEVKGGVHRQQERTQAIQQAVLHGRHARSAGEPEQHHGSARVAPDRDGVHGAAFGSADWWGVIGVGVVNASAAGA